MKTKLAFLLVLVTGLGTGIGLAVTKPWSSDSPPKIYTVKAVVTERIKTYQNDYLFTLRVVYSDEKLLDKSIHYPFPDFKNIGGKIVVFFADAYGYGTSFPLTAEQKAQMLRAKVGTVILLQYRRLPTPPERSDPYKTGEIKTYPANDPKCSSLGTSLSKNGSMTRGCTQITPGPVLDWRSKWSVIAKSVTVTSPKAKA